MTTRAPAKQITIFIEKTDSNWKGNYVLLYINEIFIFLFVKTQLTFFYVDLFYSNAFRWILCFQKCMFLFETWFPVVLTVLVEGLLKWSHWTALVFQGQMRRRGQLKQTDQIDISRIQSQTYIANMRVKWWHLQVWNATFITCKRNRCCLYVDIELFVYRNFRRSVVLPIYLCKSLTFTFLFYWCFTY